MCYRLIAAKRKEAHKESKEFVDLSSIINGYYSLTERRRTTYRDKKKRPQKNSTGSVLSKGSTELVRLYNERLLDCLDVRERGELESERSSHPSQSWAPDLPSLRPPATENRKKNIEEPADKPVKSHNPSRLLTRQRQT